MFDKRHVVRDGVPAQAVVVGMRGGSQRGAMFGLQLRVQFDDGSTAEVFRRVGMHGPDELPWFAEGSLVPVRYDSADHSRVEIDMAALKAAHAASRAAASERAIEDAGRRLHGSGQAGSNLGSSARLGGEGNRGQDLGVLLIGESDRDQIAAVLRQHLADGRLTVGELEQRLDVLYGSRTRVQAAAALAGLPALGPGPALPEWLTVEG